MREKKYRAKYTGMSEISRIAEIIDETSILAKAGNWEIINAMVAAFDYANAPEIESIAVLRSTYPIRSKLPDWPHAVNKARAILGDKLRGL